MHNAHAHNKCHLRNYRTPQFKAILNFTAKRFYEFNKKACIKMSDN